MLERKFSQAIVKQLRSEGSLVLNVTGSQYQGSGWPDLLVIHTQVKCFVELKTSGALTAIQRRKIVELCKRGHPAVVLRPTHWEFYDGTITSRSAGPSLVKELKEIAEVSLVHGIVKH